MRFAAVLVLATALVACSGEPDAVSPSSTSSAGPTTAPVDTDPTTIVPDATSPPVTTAPADEPATDAVLPDGFERVQATVTEPDGTVCELCLWLADTADQRRRGLMFVTDLGPADGMAFVYPDPHRGSFWMKNTLLPLSIGFFGPDGGFLDGFDMEPCTDDPCRQYPTPDDFLVAIETNQGDLPDLGIVPGSVLALSDLPCSD